MKSPALTTTESHLITNILRRHPEVTEARIFGSRAKGTHTDRSDIDLALWGEIDELRAETIAAELEELPLPYRFDVKSFHSIKLPSLRDHIERVGIVLYP